MNVRCSQGLLLFSSIIESEENKVAAFCENVVTVFACAKNEVIEFLEKWDNDSLLTLRSVLYDKTSEFLN